MRLPLEARPESYRGDLSDWLVNRRAVAGGNLGPMSYRPIRLADIEFDRRVLSLMRKLFPWWLGLVVWLRRRNQKQTGKQAGRLAEQVAQVVVEAKEGAKTLRVLTVWLVVLTVVNVGLVAYSVFK